MTHGRRAPTIEKVAYIAGREERSETREVGRSTDWECCNTHATADEELGPKCSEICNVRLLDEPKDNCCICTSNVFCRRPEHNLQVSGGEKRNIFALLRSCFLCNSQNHFCDIHTIRSHISIHLPMLCRSQLSVSYLHSCVMHGVSESHATLVFGIP